MLGPICQMSVMGRWCQIVARKRSPSSTPIWLSSCFAWMSSATLARNRFVPTPAVAQIIVSRYTSSMSMRASPTPSVS